VRWEDAVGQEEGILTDIRTHDEGKEIARGEAKAATGRGLLGISLVVTTVTSEVGRFLIIGSGQPFDPRPDKFSHPSLPPPQSLFQPSPATVSETQLSQPGSALSGPNISMPT
jgi:hypothetical protein